MQQEGFADAVFAELRLNEHVLQIDARAPAPSRVVVEVQGETNRHAVLLGDQAPISRLRAEPVPQKICFGGLDRVRLALILRERIDELQNQSDIVFCRRSNVQHRSPEVFEIDRENYSIVLTGTWRSSYAAVDLQFSILN